MKRTMELRNVVDIRGVAGLPYIGGGAGGVVTSRSYKWVSSPENASNPYMELSLDAVDPRILRRFFSDIDASITVLCDDPEFQDFLWSRLYPGRERDEGTSIGVRATQRLGLGDRDLEVGHTEFVDGESINPEFRYSKQEAAVKNLMLALEGVPGVDAVGDVPALIFDMLKGSQHRVSEYSVQEGYAADERRAFERYRKMSLGRFP